MTGLHFSDCKLVIVPNIDGCVCTDGLEYFLSIDVYSPLSLNLRLASLFKKMNR